VFVFHFVRVKMSRWAPLSLPIFNLGLSYPAFQHCAARVPNPQPVPHPPTSRDPCAPLPPSQLPLPCSRPRRPPAPPHRLSNPSVLAYIIIRVSIAHRAILPTPGPAARYHRRRRLDVRAPSVPRVVVVDAVVDVHVAANPSDPPCAGATGQGLTLVHFSAELEPCLHKKTPYTPSTPPNIPLKRATRPLRAPPVPCKAMKLS